MSCFVVAPTFLPTHSLIASITQEIIPTVTTTLEHLLTTNQFIRFRIPRTYGMWQINNLVGIIAVTGATTFIVNINTVAFDAFVVPGTQVQCAQIIPVGEDALTLEGAVRNDL
jgi:hypothetical protein